MASKLLGQIDDHFAEVTDPRVNRGENCPLVEMVFLALAATICDANSWVDVARWPGVKTIGVIDRSREIEGVIETAQECFITSLPCKVRAIAKQLRAHWSIENSQHHVLDVTFAEDASRIRNGTGPEISSVFRRLALTILQQDTSIPDNIHGKRKRCGWNEHTLERLIAGFTEV